MTPTQSVEETSSGTVLTYGSVELRLCPLYQPGDVMSVSALIRLEVVNRVEHADGLVLLSMAPRPGKQRPSLLGVLFTHYIRHALADNVDHQSTEVQLAIPSERIRLMTERAFMNDLIQRSVASSLAFHPQVKYL